MPAVIAQEGDVLQTVKPVRVIHHYRVGRAITEFKETLKYTANTIDIIVYNIIRQKLSLVVLAGRVADFRGAAAHQHDGFVAAPLQQPQQHDRHQAAGVQRIGGRVEADIGRHGPLVRQCVERVGIRALVHETAVRGGLQELRAGTGHWMVSIRMLWRLPTGGPFITIVVCKQ